MFGGDQRRSRNSQWSTTGGQQDGGQQLPTQPSSSDSGMIPGAPSLYDPSPVGPQPQTSVNDHQWLHSTANQFASGFGSGAYSIPYRQQQPQSSRALHDSFSRPQQQTAVQLSQTQQQAAPHLLNQYNFVTPQYQPPRHTQFPLDQPAASGYRPQVLNESHLYGQVTSNPPNPGQDTSRLENFPYSQQFPFFNSPLSELANNATSSSSSSELLAYPPPHGPSVSPAVSDRSSQRNTSGPSPPSPLTSSTSGANPAFASAESDITQKKAARSTKKRKGVKRPRTGGDTTTDSDDDLGGVTNFSIHLTQPPRGSDFSFPTRL